jgi:hypothetical protein
MERIYLAKKNVENQFHFYVLIKELVDIFLRGIEVDCWKMDKKFRKRLYEEFIRHDGMYVQIFFGSYAKIVFSLCDEEIEKEFGALVFEMDGTHVQYYLS